MNETPCPVCKKGVLFEGKTGYTCSRRYNKTKPCMVEVGQCSSPEEFALQARRSIEQYEKNKRAARKLFDSPRRLSELKSLVEETTTKIRLIAWRVDLLMTLPAVPRKDIARLMNVLDQANDALMHFGLGYSFKKIAKLKKPKKER